VAGVLSPVFSAVSLPVAALSLPVASLSLRSPSVDSEPALGSSLPVSVPDVSPDVAPVVLPGWVPVVVAVVLPDVVAVVLSVPVDDAEPALGDPSDTECSEDGELDSVVAQATPCPVATAAPTPSATANPPTRPTYADAPIYHSSICASPTRRHSDIPVRAFVAEPA
jgi:hypothetical protein